MFFFASMSKRVLLRNLSSDKNQFHQRVYFHANQTFFRKISLQRRLVSTFRNTDTRSLGKDLSPKSPYSKKYLTEESKKKAFCFCLVFASCWCQAKHQCTQVGLQTCFLGHWSKLQWITTDNWLTRGLAYEVSGLNRGTYFPCKTTMCLLDKNDGSIACRYITAIYLRINLGYGSLKTNTVKDYFLCFRKISRHLYPAWR